MSSRDLAQSILGGINIAVYVRDPQKNILFMNIKAQQVTGWTAADAANRKCWEVFGDPEGACRNSCPADFPLPGLQPGGRTFERCIKTRGGQFLYFSALASDLVSGREVIGSIIALVGQGPPRACGEGQEGAAGPEEQCGIEKALRESEEKYHQLLEYIEDGFYEVDLAGNLLYCNRAMARIYGIDDRESIKGINYRNYMDRENTNQVFQAYNNVFSTGRPEKGFILEIRRQDRSRRILEVSISLIRDRRERPSGFRGMVRDITERRQAEERLKYISMHDVMTGLYNRAYFEEELARLNRSRFSPVTIICCDVDGLKLVNDTFGHKRGDDLLKAVALVLNSPFRGSDVVARTGGDEFAVILPKTGEEAAGLICDRIYQAVDDYNMKGADIPISLSIGRATGKISKETSCQELYRHADNDMYRQKLQRKTTSRGAAVRSLLKALDEKDFLAGGHAQRVLEYSNMLGKAAGVPASDLDSLRLLAQFHDIGKVGVSDSILFKARPLNKKEWEEVRQHCEIGYRIARSTPELAAVADLILHHHEWWNGRGYPLGLHGSEIPLACRIFSIAESYDAMTSQRPYRKNISREEALKEILRNSSTQYDPELCTIFVEIMSGPGQEE